MKMKIVLIASILTSYSCAWYGTDKNGKPTGVMLATRAGKLVHTEEGFYAENLDTQTGFKDAADFAGLAVGSYFTADVAKAWSADSIAVDKATVDAGVKTTGMKETTKRIGIRESAATERAKIHATPVP